MNLSRLSLISGGVEEMETEKLTVSRDVEKFYSVGYFADDRDMRLVVQLIDSRHDMTKEDRQMIDFLVEGGFPFVVVLTKIDKLNKSERTKQLAFFEETFAELEGLTVLPFSSEKGEGKEDLVALLEEALSD